MKYKLIIFDYDQTIAATKSSVVDLFIKLGKKYDLTITKEDVLKYWGVNFPEFLQVVLKYSDSYENLLKNYLELRSTINIKFFEDAERVLKSLIDITDVGILTSASLSLIQSDLSKRNLKFKFIQTAEDTDFHKPDPRVFNPILERFSNLNKDEILYIGDSIDDYNSSIDAGLDFIGMYHDNENKEMFDKVGARGVEGFKELEVLLIE